MVEIPLKKVGSEMLLVPLFKGDLGGSLDHLRFVYTIPPSPKSPYP